ncbi:MAG: FAD-binding oxidoreductase [Chloroflexota bacterium]|nr:FAD-binding oxidoreductase [Chloroflexota bacterium]MDE2942380.1 FAD-binding oxidoreductase [Chloroflexota bacterium]MDE3267940.1 FAD-binding oxidoreductase [Chloroflexota bacterium]
MNLPHQDAAPTIESAVKAIGGIVGPKHVLLDSASLGYYSADALGRWRGGAPDPQAPRVFAVARPGSTAQVAELVRLANREGLALVPFGGGTGVAGAITPMQGGVAVDMCRMNCIVSVDAKARTATAEAGVVLGDLNAALARDGLFVGHDPYSVPIATVGGTISTNGVGYRAAKYGSMGEQVLGLEVVLPTGDTIRTSAVPKTSAGPALRHLFIGAEGVFGIITQATLRVFREPEAREFRTFDFPTFEDGYNAMLEMFSIGLRPALVDLTEEPDESPGNPAPFKTWLYMVFEGYTEEVEAQVARAARVCAACHGADIGPNPSLEYWARRHDSAYRYKERFVDAPPEVCPESRGWPRTSAYPHVAIPASCVPEYRRRCQEIADRAGLQIREYALWTQPELFSVVLVDVGLEENGASGRLEETVDEVLSVAQDMGGSMEYVHGVGTRLNHLMGRELGDGMQALRDLKRALDPRGIMNPGKLGL